MPYGPGTYGSKVGRPSKKIKRKKRSAKKSIRENVYNRLGTLLLEKKKKDKKWLQKAVNPKHEGWCTPMTKSTCTGHRRAFAQLMKRKKGFH
jgi:hypothetical protein